MDCYMQNVKRLGCNFPCQRFNYFPVDLLFLFFSNDKISIMKKLPIADLIKVEDYSFTSKYLQISDSVIREIKNGNIRREIICLLLMN